MLGALQWEVNETRIARPAVERNHEKSSGIRGDNVRGAAVASTVLLQLRVLRLGLLQDGDVGVGVFP
jgi:hypothetical protein